MKSGGLTSNLLLLPIWLILLAIAVPALREIARMPLPASSRAQSAASAYTRAGLGAHAGCLPSGDGYLRMRLRDSNGPDLEIDWKDTDMQCDGGVRPDGQRMRMMFAGPLPDGHRLRVVFGIATVADITTARNVPTNVTVIYEDEQKLFSTAGDSKCTIDALTLQQPVQQLSGPAGSSLRRFVARGFCTEPATSVTGTETLLLDRFDFAGDVLDEDHN